MEIPSDGLFSQLIGADLQKRACDYAALFFQAYSWWSPPRTGRLGDDPQFPLFVGADCIPFHETAAALCRNSRSETVVRAPSIVVTDPFSQDPTEMLLVQRDHEIQTLASYGPDQSFTKCIRLRRLWRCFQDLDSETLD